MARTKTASAAAPSTLEAKAVAPKAVAKLLKKGTAATWTTASRFGKNTYTGTIVCHVEAHAAAANAPKAAAKFIDLTKTSNRARYVVKMADESFAFASAKSTTAQ